MEKPLPSQMTSNTPSKPWANSTICGDGSTMIRPQGVLYDSEGQGVTRNIYAVLSNARGCRRHRMVGSWGILESSKPQSAAFLQCISAWGAKHHPFHMNEGHGSEIGFLLTLHGRWLGHQTTFIKVLEQMFNIGCLKTLRFSVNSVGLVPKYSLRIWN